MRKLQRHLRHGALAVGMMLALPAIATTYYCDNDANSHQYPHCQGGSPGGTYYSGQSHDVNGDDRRLAGRGSGKYCPSGSMLFNSLHPYTWSVWLYNNNFRSTDTTYAALNLSTSTPTEAFSVRVNQNTAPGGWKVLGKGSGSSQYLLIGSCGSSTSALAGIDEVRASFSASSKAQSAGPAIGGGGDDVVDTGNSCGVDMARMDPRIAAIQQKMLSAPDHYRDISGAFHIVFADVQQDDRVDFQSSESSRSSHVNTVDALGQTTVDIASATSRLSMRPAQRSYQRQALAPVDATTQTGPRYYHNAQCQPVFTHREDPAHAFAASDVTSPENYAFWLSTSPSRIAGHETLLGRSVTVISGEQDAYLASKLGAARFTMWVDDATGVLLKLVGSNSEGRTVYAIDVSSLAIDRGVQPDIAMLAKPPAGWTAVAPPQLANLQTH